MLFQKAFSVVVALVLSSGTAFAASETPISTKDAKAFVEQLREMGYSPNALDETSQPSTVIHTNGNDYGITLGSGPVKLLA